MHWRGIFLTVAGASAVLAAALGPARAARPVPTKSTSQVPVSQADEFGQPVRLDTDVYLPAGAPPAGGWPLVELFHGGGSDKTNSFDSGHAWVLAEHGYGVVLYSQRGNGNSTGQEAVAGPAEIRDIFDVTHWALQHYPLDASRIALGGYSQGGLNTNLAQVWAADPAINPYGIRFRALLPGNTPDMVFDALVPNGVVKLSVGVGLVATYAMGPKYRVSPLLGKWIATAAADQPRLYGAGPCVHDPHDTPSSAMRADLAWRSVGCQPGRMGLPWLWAQAFDDEVFSSNMAINMWRAAPDQSDHALYLSMGGHTAPAADPAVEADKLNMQIAFLDHLLKGAPFKNDPVVYWTRNPDVAVPSSSYRYPSAAWFRQTASTWPPPGTARSTWQLGADGRAVASRPAPSGPVVLGPLSEDEARDTVAATVMASTPIGTSPVPSQVPPTDVPGSLARFTFAPLRGVFDLDGAVTGRLLWTPASPDTQLVLKLFDVGPTGRLTLLSRGVQGVRGAVPGQTQTVDITTTAMSARVKPGHHLEAWVSAGDVVFYKPYPGGLGGVLHAGPGSTLTLPLRPAA